MINLDTLTKNEIGEDLELMECFDDHDCKARYGDHGCLPCDRWAEVRDTPVYLGILKEIRARKYD